MVDIVLCSIIIGSILQMRQGHRLNNLSKVTSLVCGRVELHFSGLIPRFVLLILTEGREAGEVAGAVGKNKWDYRNGRGTGTRVKAH